MLPIISLLYGLWLRLDSFVYIYEYQANYIMLALLSIHDVTCRGILICARLNCKETPFAAQLVALSIWTPSIWQDTRSCLPSQQPA